MGHNNAELIEWCVATRPIDGETESGDSYVVEHLPNGCLIAVIDGLGHGPEAALASEMAVNLLKSNANETVTDLIKLCHKKLMKTRGVVLTVAKLYALDDTMAWVGVGNVEGVLAQTNNNNKREYVSLRGGALGFEIPPLRPNTIKVNKGDMLFFATDGIHSGFVSDLELTGPIQQIADNILENHGRHNDDSLVLVARYLGGKS